MADLDAWGICHGYWDTAGHWREVPRETTAAVLAAMGATAEKPPSCAPLVTMGPEGPWPSLPPGYLLLEGGGSVEVPDRDENGALSLPFGYHEFQSADGATSLTVAVCPAHCPSPPAGRHWGWSAQLYACRSRESWGIGDFADLRRLVEWADDAGAAFVLLNPLHAPAPGPVPEASPYFPSSRCFLNPLYIRVENIPGAISSPRIVTLGDKARSLNNERLIDRARVWALKSEALEHLFVVFEEVTDEGFEQYVRARGQTLDGYTTFCALAEVYGLPWQHWPERYQQPADEVVAEFAHTDEGRRRKRYHAWLQWICERQLQDATEGLSAGLICDLAIGADGGGADAWLWQETFDLDMRVGAPPDAFNPAGQDWGLPPLGPWKLRAASYEPYIQVLRAALRPARGLRIDHVMGLFRLFWVPLGSPPSAGTYVRYVWQDMVRLLRLEALRARAYVIGEDLGTVEPHVREVLGQSGALSYKLLWFEDHPPADWPEQALGAVTTHDLPTVTGVWTAADMEAQARIGMAVNEQGYAEMRRRLAQWAGCGAGGGDDVVEVVEQAYATLASAPCSLVVAVLEDAAAIAERPNMPGTIDQWPNWCLALPVPLEELVRSELPAAIARRLSAR